MSEVHWYLRRRARNRLRIELGLPLTGTRNGLAESNVGVIALSAAYHIGGLKYRKDAISGALADGTTRYQVQRNTSNN